MIRPAAQTSPAFRLAAVPRRAGLFCLFVERHRTQKRPAAVDGLRSSVCCSCLGGYRNYSGSATDTRQNGTSAHAHVLAHHHAGNLRDTVRPCHGVCLPSVEEIKEYHRICIASIANIVFVLFLIPKPPMGQEGSTSCAPQPFFSPGPHAAAPRGGAACGKTARSPRRRSSPAPRTPGAGYPSGESGRTPVPGTAPPAHRRRSCP